MKNTVTRGRVAALAALLAIGAFVVMANGSAVASSEHDNGVPSEHWGIITRNTIGSPVADLRNGPYGTFGVTGPSARPPLGKGSLGIETADSSTTLTSGGPAEKVDFGNEVDFLGDRVIDLNRLGFHVFQTSENVGFGGARNMPNIKMEIDPNLVNPLCVGINYTTMVWVPGPAPVNDRWSGFIDATTNGNWYFTNTNVQTCTGCTSALNCTWAQAKNALNDPDGNPAIIYTIAVAKGRDNLWAGAVDGLRINNSVFDFELFGVFENRCGGGHHNC